jgi:glycosyltransferase involved in cell wall biosynthesis
MTRQWTALPNFVDCAVFRPAVDAVEKRAIRETMGLPPDAFVVGCVAAVKKHHKRVDYLIREFAQYQTVPGQKNSNMDMQDAQDKGTASKELSCKSCLSMLIPSLSPPYLLIVGSRTDDTPELLALAESLIPGRYKIMTNCARDQMPDLLRAMDVFVLASLFEMMPIAVLEGLASGLPVITHNHPVMMWMTGAGKSPAGEGGLAIDMSKDGALAYALACLTPGWIAEHGRQARGRALAMFSKEVVIRQYVDYYRQVLADGDFTTNGH